MKALTEPEAQKAINRLLTNEFFRIHELFTKNKVGSDYVLNLLVNLSEEQSQVTASGLVHVKDALALLRAMDENEIPKQKKDTLAEKITTGRKASDWDTSARVLLVWENGIAFTKMPVCPVEGLMNYEGRN